MQIALRQCIELDQSSVDQGGIASAQIGTNGADAHDDVADGRDFKIDKLGVIVIVALLTLIDTGGSQNTVFAKVVLHLPERLHGSQRCIKIAAQEFAQNC
ncbi:hypothetical protein D3C87_1435360 [compost metagenome]